MANHTSPRPRRTPVINPADIKARIGTSYPGAFKGASEQRMKKPLGEAAGLKGLGVNLTTLPPGGASALRHWHSKEDEFIYVLEGEIILITDAGEHVLGPGMAAGFPAGEPDGHCYCNRSSAPAVILEIGGRDDTDVVTYPDDSLTFAQGPDGFGFYGEDGLAPDGARSGRYNTN